MTISFLNDPDSYSFLLYTIGILTIPVHIFGAYCILFQTPETMNHVKWVMFNLHFFNSWLDWTMSIFTQPFMIPPIFGGCMMGCLVGLGVDLKLQVYVLVTLITMVTISTIAIFENRFYILFAEKTWWRYGRKLFYLINYFFALLYFIPTILIIPDQESARKEVFDLYPEVMHFHTPEHPIYVLVNDDTDQEGIWKRQVFSLSNSIITGVTFVFLLHWNIWKSTKKMTISENTLKLQRKFLKAVYMQFGLPALIVGIPQLLLVTRVVSNSLELNNMTYILLSIHGASATLIMLYCHAPYNEFCRKMVCKKSKKVATTGTCMTTVGG